MKSILKLAVLSIAGLSLANCTCPAKKGDCCGKPGGACCSAPAKCAHGAAKADCSKCKGM